MKRNRIVAIIYFFLMLVFCITGLVLLVIGKFNYERLKQAGIVLSFVSTSGLIGMMVGLRVNE